MAAILSRYSFSEGSARKRRITVLVALADLGVQPAQQEQVLARLVVVDGHQHLPVTGDDQALRLVEPLRKTPDTVHLDQAVRRIQGRLEPGDAARLVAQQIDPAIGPTVARDSGGVGNSPASAIPSDADLTESH
jgi:hypothetical protein